jgi:hypothetical protein
MTVTKQQWLEDLKNTNAELEAYRKIADGYEILERLPENRESGKDLEYRAKSSYYESLHARCGAFLEKLESYGGRFEEGE